MDRESVEIVNANLQRKDLIMVFFYDLLSALILVFALISIVTAQQQPQPHQQNNNNCSWVETK